MSVRGCTVIGIEGTHASGKTTLVHALVAHYRERGVHVDGTGEPARTSPFIEEIVIHGRGSFDLVTEIDLFAAQLTALLRTARYHTMLIADKTIANVLAYARVVLCAPPGSHNAAVLDAMAAFCRAWAHVYDAVFFCADQYGQQPPGDGFRDKVLHLQHDVAQAVRATCADAGLPLVDVPTGLTVDERVHWVTGRIADLGIAPDPVA